MKGLLEFLLFLFILNLVCNEDFRDKVVDTVNNVVAIEVTLKDDKKNKIHKLSPLSPTSPSVIETTRVTIFDTTSVIDNVDTEQNDWQNRFK